MFKRIESTMAAIKTKLLADDTIKKLLFNDTENALKGTVPESKDVDKYITLKPVFEFENKQNYDQNSMINIYMTQAAPSDEDKSVTAAIQVNVVCNTDVWNLEGNKIRPLQLASRIEELVNNAKFTASNKLVLSTVTDLIINKKMVGYALIFEITDGSGTINKF